MADGEWHIGPDSISHYTSTPPDVVEAAATRTAAVSEDAKESGDGDAAAAGERDNCLPAGYTLTPDIFDGFSIRSSPGLSMVAWARMGHWRKNLYAFLMALAMRLPVGRDAEGGAGGGVSFVRYIGTADATGESACFGRLTVGGVTHEATATAASNTKARHAVAKALIDASGLWAWLKQHHATTVFDDAGVGAAADDDE